MPSRSTPLRLEPRFRFSSGRLPEFGPGKAELLEHIERTGSIADAARAMGMSYMRAWTLVKAMDRGFAEPLVRKERGGHRRGGAELTPTGREVLRVYRELEERIAPAMTAATQAMGHLLRSSS